MIRDFGCNDAEAWVAEQKKKSPAASDRVLGFISGFRFMQGCVDASKVLEQQFMRGYCYYFAVMMQDAFGGLLYLVKSQDHIIWSPDGQCFYDIQGVCNGKYPKRDIVPVTKDECMRYRKISRKFAAVKKAV